MENDIKIEQMKLSALDALLLFLRGAYEDNPRQSDPAYWDWHFLEPSHSDSQSLPVWLAKSGERIVGQLGAISVEVNVNGKIAKAIWILDLIVDPDFRRMGIAKRLVLEAERFCPLMLGVNTNKQHAPVLLQSLGFVIVTKIPRFHKLLFPGEVLSKKINLKLVRSVIDLVYAPFRPSKNGTKKSGIRILNDFDGSFDEFWDEARHGWSCSVLRSSAMLKWQFRQQPNKKYDILGYYEDDKLLGYAILFFRKKNAAGAIEKAAVSDICYHPDNAKSIVDVLISGSLQTAVERRAGGIVIDALDPLLEERLRHFGFWSVKSGLQLMAKSPENQDFLYDANNWFLTRGDSDISIFEHPNL